MAETTGQPGDELADIMPPMAPTPIAATKPTIADASTKPNADGLLPANDSPEAAKGPEDTAATAKVDGMTVQTADVAMKAAKIAGKERKRKVKKRETFEFSIADQQIEDPERAYKNFMEAIDLVKKHVPKFLQFKVNDIKFQKLAGDVVGKSTESSTTIDPVMLLHPVMRLATVLFHEILHHHNQIPNEGLVHTQAEMHFGGMSTVAEYDQAVEKFTKFADIYGKGDIDGASKEIYKLYYRASKDNKPIHYMSIYTKFAKRARKTGYFADEPAIKKFFKEVFPELKMVETM